MPLPNYSDKARTAQKEEPKQQPAPAVTPVLNLWNQPQPQTQKPVPTAPGAPPSGMSFWPQGQPALQQQATMTAKPKVEMTPLESYLEQGGNWGPFGSGKEGYQKWFDEFSAVHNQAPTEQDVVDFWDSVGFLQQTGRPATQREWDNRWYTGTWGGNEYRDRTRARTQAGFDVWSIYPNNPALNWWS